MIPKSPQSSIAPGTVSFTIQKISFELIVSIVNVCKSGVYIY